MTTETTEANPIYTCRLEAVFEPKAKIFGAKNLRKKSIETELRWLKHIK